MKPTISVCMTVRDELPFLVKGLPMIRKWADQIVIVDTGSVDGTIDFLKSDLTSEDVLILSPKNTVPAHGFSYPRNVAAENAKCEWIHALDADEMVSFEQQDTVKDYLASITQSVVSIKTITFHGQEGYRPTEWERISNECKSSEDRHRRIYRRGVGILWRGYIHEELYLGERNCHGMHAESPLKHLHYSAFRSWADPVVKDRRYAWMLLRAYMKPELRRYTNSWWYDSYVPQNLEKLKAMAQEYVNHKYDFVEKE